jgi:predicted small lipoprotein YifL
MEGKVIRALMVAMLALGLASCGGSGPLSRADLVKQANAICKQRTADVAAMRKRVHTRDFATFVAAVLPVVDKDTSKLEALKPPQELKSAYTTWTAGVRAQITHVRGSLAALRAHRRAPSGESPAAAERQAKLARQLGLTSCL